MHHSFCTCLRLPKTFKRENTFLWVVGSCGMWGEKPPQIPHNCPGTSYKKRSHPKQFNQYFLLTAVSRCCFAVFSCCVIEERAEKPQQKAQTGCNQVLRRMLKLKPCTLDFAPFLKFTEHVWVRRPAGGTHSTFTQRFRSWAAGPRSVSLGRAITDYCHRE